MAIASLLCLPLLATILAYPNWIFLLISETVCWRQLGRILVNEIPSNRRESTRGIVKPLQRRRVLEFLFKDRNSHISILRESSISEKEVATRETMLDSMAYKKQVISIGKIRNMRKTER